MCLMCAAAGPAAVNFSLKMVRARWHLVHHRAPSRASRAVAGWKKRFRQPVQLAAHYLCPGWVNPIRQHLERGWLVLDDP